jgi:hypothetical protein
MLDKTEIALLEVAKKEIDKKMAMKGNDKKTTGLSLFTSFIHADSSIPSRHKIRRIVRNGCKTERIIKGWKITS